MEYLRDLTRDDAQRPVLIGLIVGAIWVVLLLIFWIFGPESSGYVSWPSRILSWLGVILPFALIWLAVSLARSVATLKDEAERLRETLVHMGRDESVGDAPQPQQRPAQQRPEQKRPEQKPTPQPARAAAAKPLHGGVRVVTPRPEDARQKSLGFDGPEPQLADPNDIVLALNFPEGPDDRETIAALRAALRDPDCARALRAGQDIITLFAEAGLYMEDTEVLPVPAQSWRAFSEGERSINVTRAMGRFVSQEPLETVQELIRTDEIFRDAAHHFMRHFDLLLTKVLPRLNDQQIVILEQTRSARAFQLLGRVAGLFGENDPRGDL